MKVVLVNPANGLYDKKYLAPPLGLLTLASTVRASSYEVVILDLNLEVISDPSIGGERFYDIACDLIVAAAPDVLGFTSMCLESHVSLKLAQRIKRVSPKVVTILGGTHFGAIGEEVLNRFPFIDYVVEGEGENALLAILAHTDGTGGLPANVWHRDQGAVSKGRNEHVRPPLEEVLFPAYDLVDLPRYFAINPDYLLNYEAGRGCVFKCSFCYSPFQYGDAVRNKSPERVVEDLRQLAELGARHIFFVQDNFLNSPRWAAELSRKIADADLPLTWECYATYPQLSEPVIDLLAQAGCVGIFTGIDAVTPESQVTMNKPFLKSWENTSRKLSYCREKGILPICAFILEGPTQPTDKVDSTILTALECLRLGCEIHINTLTLYNGTALASDMSRHPQVYSQIKPELLLDTPQVVQVNSFARRFPHLFPYHSTDMVPDHWEVFTAKVFTLYAVMIALRKTSYEYAAVDGKSLWEVLDYVDNEWVELIRRTPPPKRRLEAILRFAQHFSHRKLSVQTEALLGRELAPVVLAARETVRLVTLKVGDSLKDFVLGWFLCVSANHGFNLDSDVLDELMLDSQLTLGVASPFSTSRPEGCVLALRSETNSIRYYDLDQDKLGLLCSLLRASRDGRPFALTAGSLLQLTEEGWVWPAGDADFPLPDLAIRDSLRRMTQNFGELGKNF